MSEESYAHKNYFAIGFDYDNLLRDNMHKTNDVQQKEMFHHQ